MSSERIQKLIDRYRALGAGPELELARMLYRCIRLDDRMKSAVPPQEPGGKGAS